MSDKMERVGHVGSSGFTVTVAVHSALQSFTPVRVIVYVPSSSYVWVYVPDIAEGVSSDSSSQSIMGYPEAHVCPSPGSAVTCTVTVSPLV